MGCSIRHLVCEPVVGFRSRLQSVSSGPSGMFPYFGNMRKEKGPPGSWLFRVGPVGDEILPRYVGKTTNHEIRISIEQPGFNGKEEDFSWLT